MEVIKVTGLAEGRQDLNPRLCDSGLFPQPWFMSQVQDPANDIGRCQSSLFGRLPGCGFCCWWECVRCGLPHHAPGLMGLSGFLFFFFSDDGHNSFGIEDASLLPVLEREKGRLVAR